MLHYKSNQIEIKRILPEVDNVSTIIRKIYKHNFPETSLIDRPVIMLDQNIEVASVTENQRRVANTVASIYGRENFIVKMHPRTSINPYGETVDICKDPCPFEILTSALNMEDRVLVSMLSTACMNPKMMMNTEPYVIFTVKLTCDKNKDLYKENLLNLIYEFKNLYQNPEKVFIPETLAELQQILKTIKASH